MVDRPVRLGDRVQAGDVLLALDTTEADLAVAVAVAERAALQAHLAARAEERGATGASREAAVQAQAADRAAARASLAEAVVQRDAAQRTLSEAERLQASGAVSAAEVASARSELAAREARVAAMQARVDQSSGELSEVARAGSAAAVREQQDDEALAAELAAAEAAVRRAEEARERHRVRSPVAGTVGELPELVPGQLVTENTLVAVVVPDSELVVEARFAPERAAGRLAEGQGSRVRLVGAGGLGARRVTVREVGSEPGEDGLVPVILGFEAPPDGLHHGLVAEVEVEVEVVAPLQVLMRAAGRGE